MPRLVGKLCGGLGEAIHDAVMNCEINHRVTLLSNVMISGTFGHFKGAHRIV